MLKRQVLRQARACRALRPSSLPLSILTPGATSRLSAACKPAVLTASLRSQFIARGYASASAEAASPSGASSSGLITRFGDLSSIGVHENILRAITQDMGYVDMTDVQAMSINPALQGKDIVAQARTGTGKTLGFLLPTIQRIIEAEPKLASRSPGRTKPDDIRAIIISPTRELAEQIGAEARKLCRHTGVVVQTAVGGMNKNMMLRKTRFEGCHLLVGTPGRLRDLLSDEYSGIDAPGLSALVLDEADRMLDVGFDRELQDILHLLPNRKEKSRQTLLFSATIPKDVVGLARTYVDATNFQFVQTIKADEAPTHEKVPQHIVPVPGFEHFIPTLLEITEKAQAGQHGPDPFKAIAFFNNTSTVQLFAELFNYLTRSVPNLPPVYSIHSGLDQRQRTRAADLFRRAGSGILISSDVTARGMDFPNVTHVLQFGVPPERDQYIHRLGRTGRANKTGQGWLIVRRDEIHDARRVLPGLPIKRNDTIQSAAVDTENTDTQALPEYFKLVANAMQRVDRYLITQTYLRFLADRRRDCIDASAAAANRWVLSQGGMRELPMIPGNIRKANAALARIPGLNWGGGPRGFEDSDGGRGGFSGRGGFAGRGRGFSDRESRDPFNSMSRGRRDDRPSPGRRAAF